MFTWKNHTFRGLRSKAKSRRRKNVPSWLRGGWGSWSAGRAPPGFLRGASVTSPHFACLVPVPTEPRHMTSDSVTFQFHSKDPVFEKGNYRLNFKGRVSIPSVKNFQLVSPDDIDYIICQFGKVGEDRFHLDFRAPLNAFQAFGLALAQFNL